MSQPGREGNYIESSGSAMFVYALLKGSRLEFISGKLAHDATVTGSRAYEYLTTTFVVKEANGVLGYNRTVAVSREMITWDWLEY
jgi:rhamnogalacturonyl hydrolase YesR